VTAVIECRICHHSGHLLPPTGWTATVDGRPIMTTCQVPVQMRLPNNPRQIIAMPCGCTGQGVPTPEPVPEKLPELARCFNPGCQEFALLTSSFCSPACAEQMAALVAGTPVTVPDDGFFDDDTWMDYG